MSNKCRAFVSLFYRDELSVGENRQQLGYAAYHWGILISPKKSKGPDCYSYDVTNWARLDPITMIDHNPETQLVFSTESQCRSIAQ